MRYYSVARVWSILLFILIVSVGCAQYGRVILGDDGGGVVDIEIDKGPQRVPYPPPNNRVYDYERDNNRRYGRGPARGHYESRLPRVPPGHMPPPGLCRIWYPGTPPGKQPPPGDCRQLRRNLPPGAWLIR